MPEHEKAHPAALTRRDLLKRGALVGGVMWAAPVVLSIRTPAYAQGYELHACCQCNQPYPWPALVNGVSCEDCQAFCKDHLGVKVYRKGSVCSATNAVCDDLDTCPQDCTCPQSSCP